MVYNVWKVKYSLRFNYIQQYESRTFLCYQIWMMKDSIMQMKQSHAIPPNQHFSLLAKTNGTQRRHYEECIVRTAVCQKAPLGVKQWKNWVRTLVEVSTYVLRPLAVYSLKQDDHTTYWCGELALSTSAFLTLHIGIHPYIIHLYSLAVHSI